MSNTLILAYVGGAIHLILLLYAYPVPFSHLINRKPWRQKSSLRCAAAWECSAPSRSPP